MLTPNPPAVNPDDRYSVTEIAHLLGLSMSTVRKYLYSGDLAYQVHRITGRKFVMGRDIMAFWCGDPLRRWGR